jgi:hypothetical protein
MRNDYHVPTDTAPPPTSIERLDFIYRRLVGVPLEGIPASAAAFAKISPSINLSDETSVRSFVEVALARLPKDEADVFRAKLVEVSSDASALVVDLHHRVRPIMDDAFAADCYRRTFAYGLESVIWGASGFFETSGCG